MLGGDRSALVAIGMGYSVMCSGGVMSFSLKKFFRLNTDQTAIPASYRVWMAVFLFSSLAFSTIGAYSSLVGLAFSGLIRLAICVFFAVFAKAVYYAITHMKPGFMLVSILLGGVLLYKQVAKGIAFQGAILSTGVFVALGIFAIPSVFVLTLSAVSYCYEQFRPTVVAFVLGMNRFEKYYLWIALALLGLFCAVLYLKTSVFYATEYAGNFVPYDVIYTTDSAVIFQNNAYFDIYHVTNDLRQPLFGLFAMPFAIPAMLLAKLLFFLPNSYAILINAVQIFLVLITILMVIRMLELDAGAKPYAILLFTVTYPVLLFSYNLEQYVFAVFWLVCFLYLTSQRAQGRNIIFLAMTGSLVTSGIFFPLLSEEATLARRIHSWVYTAALYFMIVFLLSRQFVYLTGLTYLKQLVGSFGGVQNIMLEKVMQFFVMLSSLFLRPASEVVTFHAHPSYFLQPVTSIDWLGVAVFVLALTGFALNHKNRFARYSLTFVVLSVVLHIVVGWGAKENGMTLYTYYYLWAYFSLIFLGLEKILKRLRKLRFLIYAACICALVVVNGIAFAQIVRFGLANYPV